EVDAEPPPACTCTPVGPAELLLEILPAPLLLPATAPAALMLPSACFSTETVHRSPDAVLPVLTMVSAFALAPIAAVSASAAVIVHARVMWMLLAAEKKNGGRRVPSPGSINPCPSSFRGPCRGPCHGPCHAPCRSGLPRNRPRQ